MSEKVWFDTSEVAEMTGFSAAYIRDLIRRYKKIDKENFRHSGKKLLLKMPESAFNIRANVQLGRNGAAIERPKLTEYLSAYPNAPTRQKLRESEPKPTSPAVKPTGNDAVSLYGFGKLTLNGAKEEHARQKAAELKMKNDERAGKLVDKDDNERQSFEAARLTRDTILNIPDRISAELASMTDVHLVHSKLTGELIQALESIANEL